jgi:hypothetical protein
MGKSELNPANGQKVTAGRKAGANAYQRNDTSPGLHTNSDTSSITTFRVPAT